MTTPGDAPRRVRWRAASRRGECKSPPRRRHPRQGRTPVAALGALHEETHRVGCPVDDIQPERRELQDVLARHGDRLTTRRQHPHRRAGRQDPCGELRDGVHDVLAIVKDQQRVTAATPDRDQIDHGLPRGGVQQQSAGHDVDDVTPGADGGEVDEPNAVDEAQSRRDSRPRSRAASCPSLRRRRS